MNQDFSIIKEKDIEGATAVYIDTVNARFRGLKWKTMGDFGKRKFENLLILSRPTDRLIINYV